MMEPYDAESLTYRFDLGFRGMDTFYLHRSPIRKRSTAGDACHVRAFTPPLGVRTAAQIQYLTFPSRQK